MNDRKNDLMVLLLLVPAPSLGVAAAMWLSATQGTPLGQGIYAASKLWLLALPLWWWLRMDGQSISWSPPKLGGFLPAVASGLAIGTVIFAVWLFLGDTLVDTELVRAQARANGIGTPLSYLALCAYLALVNSLLEEYVWRWFVFRKCEGLMGTRPAVVAAALFFTVHHVFALKAQFNWQVTLLASSGVFVGGLIWSWFYGRYRSVWPGFISHLLVDIAIFMVGWQIIFSAQ